VPDDQEVVLQMPPRAAAVEGVRSVAPKSMPLMVTTAPPVVGAFFAAKVSTAASNVTPAVCVPITLPTVTLDTPSANCTSLDTQLTAVLDVHADVPHTPYASDELAVKL
jgi:hypothetical protein